MLTIQDLLPELEAGAIEAADAIHTPGLDLFRDIIRTTRTSKLLALTLLGPKELLGFGFDDEPTQLAAMMAIFVEIDRRIPVPSADSVGIR
jgi:hypothetical protein